jgi:hypothetical protein
MESVIVAITAKRNGIDVIAGTAFETWVSGMGYATNIIKPSTQSPVNRNILMLIKMLRVSVGFTNDEKRVPANGTSKTARTRIGVVSSLRKAPKM